MYEYFQFSIDLQVGVVTYHSSALVQIPVNVQDGNQCDFKQRLRAMSYKSGTSNLNNGKKNFTKHTGDFDSFQYIMSSATQLDPRFFYTYLKFAKESFRRAWGICCSAIHPWFLSDQF